MGIGTFVDPRLSGGKINTMTKDDLVSVVELLGEEYLLYHKVPVDVAILRGTTADENGNITMEDECLIVESLAAAQAARNSGGKVIVQVKRIVPSGQLDPHAVKIPSIFVDAVVECQNPQEHMQTFATQYNPEFVGRVSEIAASAEENDVVLDAKWVIARRAALELRDGAILNLGIGTPEYIAKVAQQSGVLDNFSLTVEPGAVGGMPASGLDFGASCFPEAIIGQDQMFDFYDGGGVDQAFLGLGQCDAQGNVNVSRFGGKIAGCGGFINITQNAKQVYFCGTFTANGLSVDVTEQGLMITREGLEPKFVEQVEQITFSALQSHTKGKRVLYITERAVFRLIPQGLEIIEIAPGLDLQRDIVQQMAFTPVISADLKTMDVRLFSERFDLNAFR